MPPINFEDILFVINPNSGQTNPHKLLKKLRRKIPGIKYLLSPSLEVFEDYMHQFHHKYKAFVAVGGDGTVRSLLPFVKGTDKILAVLPNGSGNGFARELGFSPKISHLLAALKNPHIIKVDELDINNFCCINVAGLGFDSHIAHSFQKSKVRGLFTYIFVSVFQYLRFKTIYARITINKQTIEGRYFTVSVANTRQFGNNALISPQSDPTDGLYELVLLKPPPVYMAPVLAVKLFTGNLHRSKYFTCIKTTGSTTIETNTNKIQVDGDAEITGTTVKIGIKPQSFNVLKM